MSDRVVITRDGGIAHVELARPEKLNALDMKMFEALSEAGKELATDDSIRVVVLSGQGRGFCAGLDVTSMPEMAKHREHFLSRYPGSVANHAQQPCYVWTALPQPVIAAVHGTCFGGGLQIALGADIRIVAPDAQLSVMEVKWGLVPDMTGSQRLRHLVRLDVAKELTFTGRKVSGEEAVALGLCTRVAADPRAEAMSLARVIADKSPDAVRWSKHLLEKGHGLDEAQGFALEAKLQAALIGSPNQMEAVMSNIEKRPPKWHPPLEIPAD